MFEGILGKKNKNSSLDSLFYPKSIAVIGASNNKDKIGGFIFSQIKDLKGISSYPINIKFKKIQDVNAYTNVVEIKGKVDLVIIAIPANVVISAIEDCVKAGIRNLVVITAGFKETGEAGFEREEEIKRIIIENDLNLIGPNCLGFLNAEIGMNCSFANECPRFGGVALVSQSGAVVDAILDWSFISNIGFSKVVSLGNMAGVNTISILEYLKDDSKTEAVVFYMETIGDGAKFAKILRETSNVKPVIIIKPGTSEDARKAIGSHTGSLAQDNVLVKTLIEENNGIFVETLNELYNVLIGLKSNLPVGKRTALITNAGGIGVIATDNVSKYGFELYKFSDDEKSKFDFLPVEASLNNPIDILGDARSDRYLKILEVVAKNNDIDNILVLLTPQIMTDCVNVAKAVEGVVNGSDKTIYTCFLGGKQVAGALDYLGEKGIASFFSPSDAVLALKQLYDYKTFEYVDLVDKEYSFNQSDVDKINSELNGKSGLLDYNLTKRIINVFKINMPEKIVLDTIDDILGTSLEVGKKYVMKVDSIDIIHKKDVGGIRLGINSDNFSDIAIEMFEEISKITPNFTINVEEEVSGHEVIVGLKQEEGLGNFVMFGMGGTYVDLYDDANFAMCPLTRSNVGEFVQRSKAFKILNGFRGGDKVNFAHLNEILIRFSYLQAVFPQIKEVDFNPIICSSSGIYLVDVKLIL